MEFFKRKINIDFMGLRFFTACLSMVFCLLAVVSLSVKGLYFGLDFTGGTQFQLSYDQPVNITHIRESLSHAGFTTAIVQSYGSSKDVLISIGPHASSAVFSSQQLKQKIAESLPTGHINSVDYIGPQVGKEMAQKGFLAVFIALLAIMLYIAIRFEWRFAVGAVVALIHDPVIILGIFSWFQWEFNLTVLAAVLAVIGYSLNDTIVIFDRIRENFRQSGQKTAIQVVNLSINQTLSRTVMTSAMTLLVVLALLIDGGQMIHGFSIALIIGIIVGTYSSIYIAGALSVTLGLNKNSLMPMRKEAVDNRP